MKYSLRKQDRLLKKLLQYAMPSDKFRINDFQSIQDKLGFQSTSELKKYLLILEWEQMIDYDDDGGIKYIDILPNAFSRYGTMKHENRLTTLTIVISGLSLAVAVIGILFSIVNML